ncbi:hypothetical protein [Conexibacter woesei]|uniref:Uncharacterized protein n=1 Tax=Conexibacter woesei (strain DSM 14684 / CCUG 47730 / CIP 108061 / JCM 11494 / NBRC 100937 / ID131577) TaxID=469383 RepID=D3FAZ2_CONWI|nr:hypothetical protein [Conexibacter woesei]ADB51305.1 hypothetical protein Cwoe_2886 [Conexibacter woesei DSM 14684]
MSPLGIAPLAAKIVDWGQLLEVVEAGLIAGVGISVAFSLVILGTVRASEAQQQSRTVALVGYGALAIVAVAVCIGAVIFGVSTMLTK